MSATGIGAAVRRKEDRRFITGKGNYTADVNRPGQAHAYFLRSPHAHAKIKSIDSKVAAAMPGVLAVLTGAELAADKIGNLICGWMITSKDGSQMKMAPHPAIAHGKANYVGDAVAVVVAETLALAKDAAEKVKVDYEVLPAVADPAKAQVQGVPQIHEVAANNTIYQWHLGDQKAAEAAFKAAKHVTKLDLINNRLVPNAIDPSARKRFSPMPMAATMSPMRRWRSTPTARSSGSRSRPSPISAPTCRPSPRRCRPISTAPCSPASMRSRRSIARSTRSTPIPCRSTPIAAPAVRRRRSWSSG